MKKIIAMTMTAAMMLLTLAGCGSGGASNQNAGSADADLAAGSYKVGISQFAEHGSLDNCREGFLAGLASQGIEDGKNLHVDYQNAQADTGTASQIAESFVGSVDLIAAIATPSAQSAFNAAMNTDIPTVYTAVSDPVAAGLANEDGTGTGNVTGSSDVLPVSEQLQMIRTMMPTAKKIGILYTTSETNSVSTIKTYESLAGDYGFEIISTGINTISDVDLAAANLVTQVDCLCNLTDNTVVEALQTVLDKANTQGIPVFGSEIEQVKSGCVASMGIDYYSLGYDTGVMAAKILKGEATAQETPFISASQADLYINTAAADKIGFSINDSVISGAKEVFSEITVS
ncbi:MAG: ABC transporter substrate-binding protein [Firmicutes bacterium]|nr:ABC transporter substrate-binding protein [Bacillota bacterium]